MNFSVKKQRKIRNTDADRNQKPVCLCPEKHCRNPDIRRSCRSKKGTKRTGAISSEKSERISIRQRKQLHIGYEPAAAADRLEKNMKLLEQQFEKMKEELKQTYGNHEDIKH